MSEGKFEIYTDKKGEWRFRLKAENGKVVSVSEGYKTKESCIDTINSIKKFTAVADIVLID